MSIEIRFEPAGQSGIVAEKTYLWDAAKRLGVRLPAECDGRGECDTCAVQIEQGKLLLSSVTDAERKQLSEERIAAGERLACQARIERGGEIVVRLVPAAERAETTEETVQDFRKEFKNLPLEKKLSTLFELEAVTAFQTLGAIANLPFTIGEKIMDLMAGAGRSMDARERHAQRPAEHRHPHTETTETENS